MTLNDLTVNFSSIDRKKLLSDWEWLIGSDKLPVLISAIGDVFIQSLKDNVVYHLSVATGSLREVAKSTEEFRALLQSRHFVEDEFAPKIVNGMRESGILLEKEQVYSFKILPCLGGDFSLDNLQATNIEVHFSIAGQIYNQLEDLPKGATIDSVKLNLGGQRPWWRFW